MGAEAPKNRSTGGPIPFIWAPMASAYPILGSRMLACHLAISESQEEVLRKTPQRLGHCPDRSLHGFSSCHAQHDDRNKDGGPLSPMKQSLLKTPVLLSWPSPNQAACTSVADRWHRKPLFGHSYTRHWFPTPRKAKGP